MAEAIANNLLGDRLYIRSAGVRHEGEIDGFAVAVCEELGIPLIRHQARSFAEVMELGDDLRSFDLIVALTPAAQRAALELTRFAALDIEYWPTLDPSGVGETRDLQLTAYRQTRDQIAARIGERFANLIDT